MAKNFILCLILFATIFGCQETNLKDTQQYLVGKHFVGYINDSTKIKDLKIIFENDSIVNYKEDDSFVGGLNPFQIFEKNGNHLLSIYPFDALDSTSTISHIQMIDSRFKTSKNISNHSYFIDITNAYSISEIKNELDNIIIDIDSIKLSFVFSKKQLNRNFEFGTVIDALQIPDSTKIDAFLKHF